MSEDHKNRQILKEEPLCHHLFTFDSKSAEYSRANPYSRAKIDEVGVPKHYLNKNNWPFPEYHTSNDDPSHLVDSDLRHAITSVLHMVKVAEQDAVFEFVHSVPFWMTRYDLYAVQSPQVKEDFELRRKIIYQYLDGNNSVLEIADQLDTSFDRVNSFIQRMLQLGLVRKKNESNNSSITL